MIEEHLKMSQHRMVGYAARGGFLVRVPGNNIVVLLSAGLLAAWLIVLF